MEGSGRSSESATEATQGIEALREREILQALAPSMITGQIQDERDEQGKDALREDGDGDEMEQDMTYSRALYFSSLTTLCAADKVFNGPQVLIIDRLNTSSDKGIQ